MFNIYSQEDFFFVLSMFLKVLTIYYHPGVVFPNMWYSQVVNAFKVLL